MTTVNKKETGVNIMLMMDERGISQSELAEILDVSHAAVNFWICGKRCPSMNHIVAMTRVFGCDIKDIVVLEEE